MFTRSMFSVVLAVGSKPLFMTFDSGGDEENQRLSNRTQDPLPEPEFLNVYGAQESIPRNEFRQPM